MPSLSRVAAALLLALTAPKLLLVSAQPQAEILLGDLIERQHNVNGQVYALSERVIEIRNFEYDGLGESFAKEEESARQDRSLVR